MLLSQTQQVSIIIPCFNAGRWIEEAIESCLNQTYRNLQIIIIDDGSTDNSLEIIQSYEGKVIWKTGEHRGGNAARNLGFTFAKGDYIQYLDADDYLLPDKIAKQVQFLQTTGVDVVYGDVLYQHHLPNGDIQQEPVPFLGKSSHPDDILESLITYGCFPPSAYLFRRIVLEQSRGWDEQLQAGQDRDLLISLAIHGSKFGYQPGNTAIYRRYGNITVSTANKTRLVTNFCKVLSKAEAQLTAKNMLSLKYLHALAKGYQFMAFQYQEEIGYRLYRSLLNKSLILFTKLAIKKATIRANCPPVSPISLLKSFT